MRNLKGKVAVVTGGGSGIGKAIVKGLIQEGAIVAIADLNHASAEQFAAEIVASGGHATAHPVDVSSESDFRALRDDVLSAHGVVDIVVNNAGVSPAPSEFVDMDLAAMHRLIDINLWGAVNGSHVFLPDLLRRPEASLVNIGSYAGMVGTMRVVGYCTSKFAVRGFTEALRMELTETPVVVTLVMPGITRTDLMRNTPLVEGKAKDDLAAAFDTAPAVGPEVVAASVLKGIRRGKPRVLTGKDTKMLDIITRVAPGRYSKLLYKTFKKQLSKTLGL